MPKFRDVEFPDLVGECKGDCLRITDGGDGDILIESRDEEEGMTVYNYLTPEQQDELWRRIGEARGHLLPKADKPKPWRDLGGEG